MVSQFQGRGHESYHDEIQNLFEWMELPAHRRDFFPANFGGTKDFPQGNPIQTLRTWDNFFWYAEFSGMPQAAIGTGAVDLVLSSRGIAEFLDIYEETFARKKLRATFVHFVDIGA